MGFQSDAPRLTGRFAQMEFLAENAGKTVCFLPNQRNWTEVCSPTRVTRVPVIASPDKSSVHCSNWQEQWSNEKVTSTLVKPESEQSSGQNQNWTEYCSFSQENFFLFMCNSRHKVTRVLVRDCFWPALWSPPLVHWSTLVLPGHRLLKSEAFFNSIHTKPARQTRMDCPKPAKNRKGAGREMHELTNPVGYVTQGCIKTCCIPVNHSIRAYIL